MTLIKHPKQVSFHEKVV